MPQLEVAGEFALVRDFAIIMAVAGAAVVLFRRFNQPPLLGYLIAGLLVGPFTFPNFAVTNADSIRLLADLGLVLLLFALGLEFGWRRIREIGLSVLLIGSAEILVMISVGYQTGRFLGWTHLESIFLGAALSISSSAILVKVLRDAGRLDSRAGKLIVGILVVEDFAAVILLTVLSGIASTGTASLGDIGALMAKLAIFVAASVSIGGLVVPRVIAYVARFHSAETMLLTSLGLCFALALIGQSLGVSAAAGAFLIGAVIGDTKQSEQVTRIITPIRDMFGALFFVSIGMLVDIHVIKGYAGSVLVITLVFVVGKIVANTVATFFTAQPGRVPVQVGMGMPQVGEFSLAMVKVGAEAQAIGSFVYQVIAGVTGLTSLIFPYTARSSDRAADIFERRSPAMLKRWVANLSVGLQEFRNALKFDQDFARRVRRPAITTVVNVVIIALVLGAGTVAVSSTSRLAGIVNISDEVLGSATGFVTLALCLPSAVAIWLSVRDLADETANHLLVRRRASRIWVQKTLRNVIRDSVMIFLIFLVGLWSIPFVAQLLSLGSVAIPAPFVVFAAVAYIAISSLSRIRGYLAGTFSRAFLSETRRGAFPDTSQAPVTSEPVRQAAQLVEGTGSGASLEKAAAIALAAAKADPSPYRRRLGSRQVILAVKDAAHVHGLCCITLTFRAADSPEADSGEEEVYVDAAGEIRVRQIVSWPAHTPRQVPVPLLYAGLTAVIASGIVASVYFYAPRPSPGAESTLPSLELLPAAGPDVPGRGMQGTAPYPPNLIQLLPLATSSPTALTEATPTPEVLP